MTAESEYYILSETGFGGRAFRVTEKYLEQAETIDHVAPEPQIDLDGEVVTIGRKQNSRGILYTVAARLRAPIPTRTRLALFEPADPDEYSDYVAEKLDVPLPTTTLPPTEYAQKALRESDQKTNQQPLAGESKLTFSNFERSLTSPTILPGIRAQAEALEKYGFWSNEHSFNRYQMRLSPDRCPITTEDLKQFQELTQAMFAKPRGILPGVARLLYDWQQYSDFANLGSPLMENTVAALNYLAALPVQRPDTYPRVVRLDLGRSVVNGKRTYTIFELEGTKTHAFGYVTLTETLDSSNRSNSRFTTLFYEQLRQKGWEDQDVFLVIGGAINEEFYGPELRFFVDQVNSTFGTRLRIIQEDGIAREGKILLVNLPAFSNAALRRTVLERYKAGDIDFLIPPNDAFGDKILLALLSCTQDDPTAKQLLEGYIDPKNLQTILRFLPESRVLYKSSAADFYNAEDLRKWVIKLPDQSGASGVGLPDDPAKQVNLIRKAQETPVVAQRYFACTPFPYRWVAPNDLEAIRESLMFERIELFATATGKFSMLATCKEKPPVHGGRNAIQISIEQKEPSLPSEKRLTLNLPEYLIVIRHGESSKDKSDPKRMLTPKGIAEVQRTAQELKPFLADKTVAVVCTPTDRTRQTAQIIQTELELTDAASELNPDISSSGDWKAIEQARASTDLDLTATYFRLASDGILPDGVKSPETLAAEQIQAIAGLRVGTDVVILASHAGEGDALQFQEYYLAETPDAWQQELATGEARVLCIKKI